MDTPAPVDSATRRRDYTIIFVCWLAYMSAYMGRLNYGCSLVTIQEAFGATKEQMGLVASFFFCVYGIGQFVNAFLSRRYNARLVLVGSLLVSAVCNVVMANCGGVSTMKYVWLVNGCAQSTLWCCVIKSISQTVSDRNIPNAILIISTTYAVGNLLTYGVSALSAHLGHWQISFYVGALFLLTAVSAILLLYKPSYVQATTPPAAKKDASAERRGNTAHIVFFAIAITCIAAIANGFIKEGLGTWMPSILKDGFHLAASAAILLSLFLPLVNIFGAQLNKVIYARLPSHSLMDLYDYLFCAVCCVGTLWFLRAGSLIGVLLCCIGMSLAMGMVNNVITSMLPLNFRRLVNSGFVAGMSDTFCYIGSTTTSYALGAIAEKSGWSPAFAILLAVSFAGAVFSFGAHLFERKIPQ